MTRRQYLVSKCTTILFIRDIKLGDIYDDCRYHPMLCININKREDSITGISLIDGAITECSIIHCGINKMTLKQAIWRKKNWGKFLLKIQKHNKLEAP